MAFYTPGQRFFVGCFWVSYDVRAVVVFSQDCSEQLFVAYLWPNLLLNILVSCFQSCHHLLHGKQSARILIGGKVRRSSSKQKYYPIADKYSVGSLSGKELATQLFCIFSPRNEIYMSYPPWNFCLSSNFM